MSLKLRELWDECEKMSPQTLWVFLNGLQEMVERVNKPSVSLRTEATKACVAQQVKTDRERWTLAEEDTLHKYCNEAPSVAKGVARFILQTNSDRTPGACKLRVSEMRREKRW
jgi:hypothetical protein